MISSVFAPLLGFMIDKMGRNLFLVFLAIFGTLVSHMCLTFTFINPYIAMVRLCFIFIIQILQFFLMLTINFFFKSIMGVSYSLLASALWPLIAIIIPEHQLGTAYGMQVF